MKPNVLHAINDHLTAQQIRSKWWEALMAMNVTQIKAYANE
jgi:hypothetical protein